MLKRIVALSLVLTLVLVATGLQVSSSFAAPADQSIPSAPNANLMPSDTAFYFDFRTNQITDVVKFLQDVSLKVTGNPMPDPFQDVDQTLSAVFGRSASWAKDIQPWLGDHFTFGLSLTDDQLNSLQAGKPISYDYEAILAVKNPAKADAFFKELMSKANPSPSAVQSTTDKIGNNTITIYTQSGDCGSSCMSFVQAPGYFAFGSSAGINNMIDTLKTSKPTLAAAANFGKIIKTLKPNNLVTIYLTPRLYLLSLSLQSSFRDMPSSEKISYQGGNPTPPDPQAIFKAINGQAFGLGRNGKLLYLDVVQSINTDAFASIYSAMGLPTDLLTKFTTPISGAFTGQIPAKTLFAVQARDLADLYGTVKTTIQKMPAVPSSPRGVGPNLEQLSESFTQIEAAFRFALGADLQTDVLSWMNTDFAFYVTYDPDSTWAKLNPESPNPFDYTFLAQTSDVAKTKAFLTKLDTALNGMGKVKVTSAGTDLYTLTGTNGATVSLGLVGKTFLITAGSGLKAATDAIKGVGSLTSNPVWTRAQANLVNPTTQLWYVNMNQLSTVLKAMMPADQIDQPDTKQALAFLDLFDTATITGSPITKDGLSRSSIDFMMK